MWAKDIEELDPNILQRVPVRDDDNEFYFPNDTFQAMPKDGYTPMFENIFNHKNITVTLDTDFDKSMEFDYDHVFNSMPIDVYFDKQFGELPYRSLKFHTSTLPSPKLLPVPTVNFTHDGPYTRMTEWKNYPGHGQNDLYTTITCEEPCDYRDNNFERYYPVKDVNGENRKVYEMYKDLIPSNVTFIGRCGQYVYIDIHQAVSSALSTVNKFIKSL
jgi:UDP-galactopyranose mutase